MFEKMTTNELLERYEVGERDFSYKDLSGLELSNMTLQDCDFNHSVLRNAKFENIKIKWSLIFDYADLRDSVFINLTGCPSFSYAKMEYSDFENSDLNRVCFSYADFSSSKFKGGCLYRSNFYNSNLLDSSFTDVDMPEIKIHSANLAGTYIKNCEMRNSTINSTNLYSAVIKNNNLYNNDIFNSNFNEALLVNNNFEGVDLTHNFFRETQITKDMENKLRNHPMIEGIKFINSSDEIYE